MKHKSEFKLSKLYVLGDLLCKHDWPGTEWRELNNISWARYQYLSGKASRVYPA